MMSVLPYPPLAHPPWTGFVATKVKKKKKDKKEKKKKKRRRESSSSSESPEETSSLKVSAAKAKAKAKVAPGSSKLKVSAEHDELSGLDLLIAEGLPSEKRPRHGWDEAEEKESKPGLTEEELDEIREEPRSVTGLKLIGEEAPSNLSWHYVLKDETTRSFVGFLPRTLSQDVCSSFFEKALEGAKWLQPSGPNGPIPRKTAWMVYFDCTCTYRYGRIEVEPQRYPPWMCTLMHWVMPCCGINEQKDWPNSCNLNLYQDGSASVGWHADDEHLFQGKNRDCRIISLSLGATRSFELRRNWSEADTIRLPLTAGDLCTMEGMVQKHLQHRVPREDQVRAPRINLTWRWIVRHSPGCPARRSV
ncbi:Alpha-ketoglutarate-dependent dioxygenase alkB homolog 3 (Alkylated DNA repair protein alkB homolog 3) (mAbh3) [Durusdinium trenchii]|uniref:Alpha-ketoglutarate-dependent dioxygenase alkB homolog 3 (Alkylated DNA repair protein alkB homolog 3) (MAbh3) n=1 Tax=Durusdinium trenchii TaxID=1381693 RepID=A0ABP0I5M6_9DINO